MRYWIISLCFLFNITCIAFGKDAYKSYTYESFAARDFSNWPRIIETLEKEALQNYPDSTATLDIMKYYYGYIGHLLEDRKSVV